MTPAVLQILAAGIASSVLGFIWYHPRLFGRAWMRLEGVTPEMTERAAARAHALAFFGVCAGIIVAFAVDHFATVQGIYNTAGAITLALFAWAGFVVPVLLGQLLWEQKPFVLLLINASYWLVALGVIAIIVAL